MPRLTTLELRVGSSALSPLTVLKYSAALALPLPARSAVVQLGNEAARSKEDATLPLLVIPLVAWKHWEHTIEVQH